MREPLLLYSTTTWLAYTIAERFYGGIHYAWCSPYYDGRIAAEGVAIPPSSSPAELYWNMAQDAARGDRHSGLIERNRKGIIAGARAKRDSGVIDEATRLTIEGMVKAGNPSEFRPLLLVMPFDHVRGTAREVPARERAHPLSVEYRIEALDRTCFHALELWR